MDGEALIHDGQPTTLVEFEPPPPDASAAAKPESEQKLPYPPPAELPTQEGPKGIRFDFNQGARVLLPNWSEGKWRVRLRDLDTGNILFQTENKGAIVRSSKRFFVRFSIEVWELDEGWHAHRDAGPRIRCARSRGADPAPGRDAGRHLAWFPYPARFGEAHGRRLTRAMPGLIIPLLRDVRTIPELGVAHHQRHSGNFPDVVRSFP